MKLVQFSLGATSAECALRVAGSGEPFVLITANTKVEDPDCWRFGQQVWDHLGQPTWHVITDGRTPMQAGRDERCVPNDRWAVCSRLLKRKPLREFIDANYDPATDTVVLGFDWDEPHRISKARGPWEPWRIECPLAEPPYVDKTQVLDAWRARGIEPPALYEQGFSHANCGGACVRGGQAAWELLLRTRPDTYAEWEAEEEVTREMLDKDVSILKERVAGESRPLTLRRFRERLEAQPSLFDSDDWGACNCMGEGS